MLKLYKQIAGKRIEVPWTDKIAKDFRAILHAARIVHSAGTIPPNDQQRYLDYRMGYLGAHLEAFENLEFEWESDE